MNKLHMNMSRAAAPAVMLLALASGPLFADSLALDLNNDAIRLDYRSELGRNYATDLAWTHVKDEGNTFTGGIVLKQGINRQLSAEVGGKAIFQQHDRLPDGTAMALGGTVRALIPAVPGVSLAGTVFLAPSVLSFGDMDNYQEVELRAEYRVSEQLTGYAGYVNHSADYHSSSLHLNDARLFEGLLVGAEFRF